MGKALRKSCWIATKESNIKHKQSSNIELQKRRNGRNNRTPLILFEIDGVLELPIQNLLQLGHLCQYRFFLLLELFQVLAGHFLHLFYPGLNFLLGHMSKDFSYLEPYNFLIG